MSETGYDNPHNEKASMPVRQAKLSPKRTVGNTPIMNTPKACDDITKSIMAVIIGIHPEFKGKALYPCRITHVSNPIAMNTTVYGISLPKTQTVMEPFPLLSQSRDVLCFISVPIE